MVNDPTIYPVVFSIGKRYPPIIENRTADAHFRLSGDDILKNACYFYSGNYLVDCNLSSSNSVNFVDNGKRVSFELTVGGLDIQTSNINVKTWTNEKSFFSTDDASCSSMKQSAWASSPTEYAFYESSSLSRFNPVVIGGVPYYVSVSANVDFYTEYRDVETIASLTLSPGSTVQRNVIQVGNYGLLSVILTTMFSWYYDSERTLPVSSLPTQLEEMHKPTYGFRTFFVVPGKFLTYGATGSGTSVYSGVLTKEYVASSGVDYGSLSYVGYRSATESMFVGREDAVIVDQNGYCAKPGQEGYIYFL